MKYYRLKQDKLLRKKYRKSEVFNKIFQLLYMANTSIFIKFILQKFYKLSSLSFKAKSRIKNYCIISGRSRGIIRKYKFSRISFKLTGIPDLFFGIKKAS